MYTGFLNYNNQKYSFIFEDSSNELQLIPCNDLATKASLVSIIQSGSITMEEPYLIGLINENRKTIVFITVQGATVRRVNDILYVRLFAFYLMNTNKTEKINKLSICSPEINRIFCVNRAYSFIFSDIKDYYKNGTVTVNVNDFGNTTSEPQTFLVDDKEITISFQIVRTISTRIEEPPLSLSSCLCFEFEATDDYSFIIDICCYAKDFIRFLCFRKNVYFTDVKIYMPYEKNKHLEFGSIKIFNDNHQPENEAIKTDRCIKYEYIAGHEGSILSDIKNNRLYLRHLPKSYEDGRHIDVASFIMITAAFEWEFNRNYPEGITKSEAQLKAEQEVSKTISNLINNSTGKQKDIYKFLARLVKSDSMQSKIIQIGKDYSSIIDVFGKRLYGLNQIDFKYSEIGKRVSDQRNNFAHGNIDKEFINESLLDVTYLEYIVYALQLKFFGITDENIKKSINDVFHLNIIL